MQGIVMPQIYLASSSPRRHELLAQLGVNFSVIPQSLSEDRIANEDPVSYVTRLAWEKAQAGMASIDNSNGVPILGADTAVVVDNEILGKPRDRDDGLHMLGLLSGRSHRVLSAVAIVTREGVLEACNESRVWFRDISEDERLAYWQSGEPGDKAGAYAIQGLAALFVERLEGSYSGVMGLPLFETGRLLNQAGIAILRPPDGH